MDADRARLFVALELPGAVRAALWEWGRQQLSDLAALQSQLSAALHAGGFYEPERRPFLGHVTVARVAAGTRPRPAEVPPPPPQRFDATSVTLYRSWLGSGPARYEALDTIALAG